MGVCDQEELLARQLSDRFGAGACFTEPDRLLASARPDVVHITTPPQSHYALAKRCLEAGCHVYVEKPFTVSGEEARDLIALALEKNRKITVGHDHQFSHAARRMRQLIREGYLGGPPVHMESYYSYDLGDARYAKTFLGAKDHWVRALPGRLLHNIISHGLARIAEFLDDNDPHVIANGGVSPFLSRIHEGEIIDELRVIIRDRKGATAYFTFSSQMRPALHQFRIYGPRNGLVMDHEQQTLIKLPGKRYKSYLEKFIPPLHLAGQFLANEAISLRLFWKRDFHMKSGMKFLTESLYRSILEGTEPPIPYREILLTSRLMDLIFEEIYPGNGRDAEKHDYRLRFAEPHGPQSAFV